MVRRERFSKTLITILMAAISIVYVSPIFIVLMNSF